MDTGASYHLIARRNLSFDERSLIYETTPIRIRTANGVVDASEAVSIEVQNLGNEVLKFYVLEDTVDVVSEGQLVKHHGWTYHHEPNQLAILTKKGRQPVVCEEEQNVPFIAIAKSETQPPAAATPAKHHVDEPTLDEIFR